MPRWATSTEGHREELMVELRVGQGGTSPGQKRNWIAVLRAKHGRGIQPVAALDHQGHHRAGATASHRH